MKPFRTIFVRNEGPSAAPPKQAIQSLTCNLLPKIVRNDSMEDQDFLVVPMVILTEGVHKGSGGPLYYPATELAKTPAVWNHKPVVVYHPEINGQGVSACDPSILTSRKLGLMMNTTFDKGRLKSEAWINKDRANKVDERIMAAVEKNEMMELSTGVFVDCESVEGEWKGENYIGIARNYRPDHLAVLPDKIGACSIADGAGFLRNSSDQSNRVIRLPGVLRKILDNAFMRFGVQVDNALSFNNITEQLRQAIMQRLGIDKQNYTGPYCWIADVYSNFVVYEFDGKLWRLGYNAMDDGVELSDKDPVEVSRITEYRTVMNAQAGTQDQDQNKQTDMNKKQLIDAIILAGAALGTWTEADRQELMALNDKQVEMIHNRMPKKADPTNNTNSGAAAAGAATNSNPTQAAASPSGAAAAPVTNATTTPKTEEPKVVTMDDYLKTVPPALREMVSNGLETYNEQKGQIVATILASKNNRFTKDDLNNRPLGELRNLAALIGAPEKTLSRTDYSGQGAVPVTDNSQAEEVLEAPVMNFDTKPAGKEAVAA